MVVKITLVALFIITTNYVNGIELYKMNLHKAISLNMKDAVDDKDDDDDIGMTPDKASGEFELDNSDVLAYSGDISG